MQLQRLQDVIVSEQLNSKIHIWSANLDQPENISQKYYLVLSQQEKDQADKYKVKELRDRYILSKGILKQLLADYKTCEYQEIKFEYNSFGKPCIATSSNADDICFNLSHSGNLAVFSFVKNKNIGIDVEQVQEIPDMDGVVNLCFSEFEKEWFYRISPGQKKEIFYKIWTTKEAYIKAIGKGFSFSPNRINLELNSKNEIIFKEIIGDDELKRWKLYSFNPEPGSISSVVVENNDYAIEHFNVDPRSAIYQDF